MFPQRFAVLLDGEYVKKVLGRTLRRFPSAYDIMGEVARIQTHDALAGLSLYRIFYYTAEPLGGKARHPLGGQQIDFAATPVFAHNTQLIDLIENQSNVAVRRGTVVHQGWELGSAATRALLGGTKATVAAGDIVPKIQQKGVDMRIGLDIASLAHKRLVSTLVLVTGDSDLVPALKLARREGLRVILDPLGMRYVRTDLKKHADIVL